MTTNFNNIRFSLRLGHWEFRPTLIPTIGVLLLLPLLLFLGFWQLHRAAAKQQLLEQFNLRSQQAPQPLQQDEPIYTPVQTTGHYDYAHVILLDNRIVNHRVGYDVLLPFIPHDNRQQAVLVNLGWAPKNKPPDFSLRRDDDSPITIVGLVHRPEHNLVLARPKTAIQWPLLVEDIQLDRLSHLLNRPLYPFILLLSDGKEFTPHWDIVTTITPARHRGYAIQWFALALTLIGLYIKFNIRRGI